jgi:hypothetical protein
VKKNNSLQIELSFMPEEMRKNIRGALWKREEQRTDPHYLIPDGRGFVFQRANPNYPIVAELQTCSYYASINHLLNEAGDVMNIIKTHDTKVDVYHGIDENDQGSDAHDAPSNAPSVASNTQNARDATSVPTTLLLHRDTESTLPKLRG